MRVVSPEHEVRKAACAKEAFLAVEKLVEIASKASKGGKPSDEEVDHLVGILKNAVYACTSCAPVVCFEVGGEVICQEAQRHILDSIADKLGESVERLLEAKSDAERLEALKNAIESLLALARGCAMTICLEKEVK